MSIAESIVTAAVQLPETERVRVVEALLASFDSPSNEEPHEVAEAWKKELRRRSEELRTGKVVPTSWSCIRDEGERLLDEGS